MLLIALLQRPGHCYFPWRENGTDSHISVVQLLFYLGQPGLNSSCSLFSPPPSSHPKSVFQLDRGTLLLYGCDRNLSFPSSVRCDSYLSAKCAARFFFFLFSLSPAIPGEIPFCC